MSQTLLVNRTDFSDVALVSVDDGELQEGFIRTKVGPWALTANNITYLVTGDMIGYWHFFEPKHYDIDMAGFGRMPVWGYAEVTESKCADIPKGTLIYGFLPVAQSLDMKPVKITPIGFQDGNAHRTELHPVYNGYTFVDKDPSFAAHRELQPVLRPLFTTSFLIDDFLADENFFGAEQVLLLSASSKTAMGTAFCLKQRGDIKVAGLTSEGNKAFTEKTGFYNDVYTYDSVTDMNPDMKTVVVDMAGNGTVMNNVYDHFEENIVYNCMVGKSHWEGERPPKISAGAPPIMFFAPDQAKQRIKDWGPNGFAKNLGARWIPFLNSAKDWMHVKNHDGVDAFTTVYQALLRGDVPADEGHLIRL